MQIDVESYISIFSNNLDTLRINNKAIDRKDPAIEWCLLITLTSAKFGSSGINS